MNAISAQYSLMTLLATAKNICSGALEAGPTPAVSQVFPMTPTFSPEARHASPSASRDGSPEHRMTATSGRKWLDLLHRSDPLMSLSRTLLTSSAWRSTECSLIWRARATAQGRLLFQLVPSMRRTDETDCGSLRKLWTTPTTPSGGQTVPEGTSVTGRRPDGSKATVTLANEAAMVAELWPTPNASDGNGGKGPRLGMTMTGRLPDGSKATVGLSAAAKMTADLWPTPTSRDHKDGSYTPNVPENALLGRTVWMADQALWSTPRASDGEKGGPNQSFGAGGQPLPAQAAQASGTVPDGSRDATVKPAGSLNPEFVCWLQGYPPEWLSSAPSEMPSARRRPPKSLKP
jgi:hypothetical protein